MRVVEWVVRLRVAWFGLPFGDQALFARRCVLVQIGGIPDVPLMEDLDLVSGIKTVGRLVPLALSSITSARRYRDHGVVRTLCLHWFAMQAWRLGVDRSRLAGWLGR